MPLPLRHLGLVQPIPRDVDQLAVRQHVAQQRRHAQLRRRLALQGQTGRGVVQANFPTSNEEEDGWGLLGPCMD